MAARRSNLKFWLIASKSKFYLFRYCMTFWLFHHSECYLFYLNFLEWLSSLHCFVKNASIVKLILVMWFVNSGVHILSNFASPSTYWFLDCASLGLPSNKCSLFLFALPFVFQLLYTNQWSSLPNREYRNKLARKKYIPWPIEVRFCDPPESVSQRTTQPR